MLEMRLNPKIFTLNNTIKWQGQKCTQARENKEYTLGRVVCGLRTAVSCLLREKYDLNARWDWSSLQEDERGVMCVCKMSEV